MGQGQPRQLNLSKNGVDKTGDASSDGKGVGWCFGFHAFDFLNCRLRLYLQPYCVLTPE
jgi:hypothetical protein